LRSGFSLAPVLGRLGRRSKRGRFGDRAGSNVERGEFAAVAPYPKQTM
jgi:hypothetical protein